MKQGLSQVVRQYGYEFVETPVIEHTDLFVRKSGGERLAQTFEFTFRGRHLALRPEHTASVIRMYIDQMQADPLPVRLAYSGPVFRYESPQAGRSRQFTEFGCELIGADGAAADHEIIQLAIDCLHDAGIREMTVVLGHIGVVIGFLNALSLDQRAQDWILWSMERLRSDAKYVPEVPEYLIRSEPDAASTDDLEGAAHLLDRDAVVALLRQSGVQFDSGSRSPEEIVQGLFDKQRRTHDPQVLNDAITFIKDVIALAGDPVDVLDPLRRLVSSKEIDTSPIDEVEEIARRIRVPADSTVNLRVDLGMGRGLRYYTGMLFEIYPGQEGSLQLAGGGRYDDLAQHLGARKAVPASGFSIGVERVHEALPDRMQVDAGPSVLVCGTGSAEQIQFWADAFRQRGWSALVEVRGRSENAARRWASRRNLDFLALVTDSEAVISDLRSGRVQSVQAFDELDLYITNE